MRKVRNGSVCSIPILMYHSISDRNEGAVHPYYRTSTSPTMFSVQMKHLHDNGYRTAALHEVVSKIASLDHHSDRCVAITFDDGYADFFSDAFPILNSFGFSATVFLPTAFIGDRPLIFKGRTCLTWSQVRELHRSGILFGSHTVNHPQLHGLSFAAIRQEVSISKDTIEQQIATAIDTFAYPYAFPQTDTHFKSEFAESLQSAGYSNGVCTAIGRASNRSEPLFLERLPVNSLDDAALLQAKLDGSYDWIGAVQRVFQIGKTKIKKPQISAKYNVQKELPGGHRP